MRTFLGLFFILAFCVATQFDRSAFGASKVSVDDTKAIACIFEDKESGEKEEIDRMPFRGIGTLWKLDDKCKKTSVAHAKQKGLTDWSYFCCPITKDDKVHYESPLGSRGRW